MSQPAGWWITSVRYEDGAEITRRYDRQSGLIFTTEVATAQPHITVDELIDLFCITPEAVSVSDPAVSPAPPDTPDSQP